MHREPSGVRARRLLLLVACVCVSRGVQVVARGKWGVSARFVPGLQWLARATHGGALRACGERASRVREHARERASRAVKASKPSNFSARAAGKRGQRALRGCVPHMGSMCGQPIIAARLRAITFVLWCYSSPADFNCPWRPLPAATGNLSPKCGVWSVHSVMSSVVSDTSAGSGGSFTTIVDLTNREPSAIGRRCSRDIRAALAAGQRVVPLADITPDDSVSVIGQQREAVHPLGALTPQQVGCLLNALQLGRYAQGFEQLPMRGADLEEATDEDLKEAGVAVSVHRRALLKQVAAFKQSGVPANLLVEGGPPDAHVAHPAEARAHKADAQPPSMPPPAARGRSTAVATAEQEERRRREVARARQAATERKRQVEDQRQRQALAAAQAAEQAKAAAAGAVRIQAVLRGRRSRSLSQELREAAAEEQAVSATIIAHAFGRLLRRRSDALEAASAARVALSWRRLQMTRRVERRRLRADAASRVARGWRLQRRRRLERARCEAKRNEQRAAAARISRAYAGLRRRRSEALEAASAARRARPWLRLLDLWKAVKALSSNESPGRAGAEAEPATRAVTVAAVARSHSDSLPPDSPCGSPPPPPPRRRLGSGPPSTSSTSDGSDVPTASDASAGDLTVDAVCAARRRRRRSSAAASSPPATRRVRAPSAAPRRPAWARLAWVLFSVLGVLGLAPLLLAPHLPGAPLLPPPPPSPTHAVQAGTVLAHARSKPDGACSGAAAPNGAAPLNLRWLAPLKVAAGKAVPELTARLRSLHGAAAAKAAPQVGRVKQWWQLSLRKIQARQQGRRAGDECALEVPRQ